MAERASALENLAISQAASFWRGRRVFLTGHTGFKGGWLALWLRRLGAEVHGFSLEPPTEPNLFSVAQVAGALAHDGRGDVRDYRALESAIEMADPEIVFHLAAQPLVRASYGEPLDTFAINAMGTANVLDVARRLTRLRALVVITTDKCYENTKGSRPYSEADALGGHDPYSASKACAEIIAASYRRSFYSQEGQAALATVRAGNVIGGGDWAEDRLLPDCIRAFLAAEAVRLRNPGAVRPWQHVLDPLFGYLKLAEALCRDGAGYAEAWNFGPDAEGDATVGEVAQEAAALWGDGKIALDGPGGQHEAGLLRLSSTKAKSRLAWGPRWDFGRSLAETVAWYKAWHAGADMAAYSLAQIAAYESEA